MSAQDFNVYNMPEMLGRVVQKQDSNHPEKLIRDESWYRVTRETFFYLFKFLQDKELARRKLVTAMEDVDSVVLRFSDLTVEGQAFVKSRADERWFSSLDRSGSKKKPFDVSYLEKQLEKLRSQRHVE